MIFTFVLATFTALAFHAQAGCNDGRGTLVDIRVRKWISKEKYDTFSPGILALELLLSKLEKHTIGDFELKYKAPHGHPSPPPEFSPQEIQDIGKRVRTDWCDYKKSHCYGSSCVNHACLAEREKMFMIFQTCAKNLKAYDYASVFGFKDDGLQQFLNVSLVIARQYFWTSCKQGAGVRGNAYWNMFERLVPQKYREAIKGSDYPVAIGGQHGNIDNKKAAAKCLLTARGEDISKGLAEYARRGYSSISDDLVEKVFISLLSGSIADKLLDDTMVKKLTSIKIRHNKISTWNNLGKKLKASFHDLPLCMDPLRAAINEIKVTSQLKDIAFGSSDLSDLGATVQDILQTNGNSVSGPIVMPPNPYPAIPRPYPAVLPGRPVGHTHGPVATSTTSPKKILATTTTATMLSKSVTTYPKKNNPEEPVYAGMSVGAGAPEYQPSNAAAPTRNVQSGGAPAYIMQSRDAPSRMYMQ